MKHARRTFRTLFFCEEGFGHSGMGATSFRNALTGKVPYNALGKRANYAYDVGDTRHEFLLRGYGETAFAKDRPLREREIRGVDLIVAGIPVSDDPRLDRNVKNDKLVAALRQARKEGRLVNPSEFYSIKDEELREWIQKRVTSKKPAK